MKVQQLNFSKNFLSLQKWSHLCSQRKLKEKDWIQCSNLTCKLALQTNWRHFQPSRSFYLASIMQSFFNCKLRSYLLMFYKAISLGNKVDYKPNLWHWPKTGFLIFYLLFLILTRPLWANSFKRQRL